MTRFRLLYLLLVLGMGFMPARAAITLEITEGVEGAIPVAVVEFDASAVPGGLADDIGQIVAGDLNRSGVFKVQDRASYPARPHYGKDVKYEEWRAAGKEYLVVGRVFSRQAGLTGCGRRTPERA